MKDLQTRLQFVRFKFSYTNIKKYNYLQLSQLKN